MLSIRLWRSIAEAAIDDPIFRRTSQIRRPAPKRKRRPRLPRLLMLAACLALAGAVVHSPEFLVLILIVPILMITLMVASPILLPLYIWVAGVQLTNEIIGGIFREKHQYTYDLICASTRGTLDASWAFAIGILYRSNWFMPLHWGTRLTLRAGLALLGGLGIFALHAAFSSGEAFGFEQARILLIVALLLALYYSNMTQTLALSLVIGLFASSYDLSRQDSTLIGIFAYVMLSALPLVAGVLALFAFSRVLVEPHPVTLMLVEAGAAALVVGLREAAIALLWSGLRRRLEWGADHDGPYQVAETNVLWSAAS